MLFLVAHMYCMLGYADKLSGVGGSNFAFRDTLIQQSSKYLQYNETNSVTHQNKRV